MQYGSKSPAQHTSTRCSEKLHFLCATSLCYLCISDLDAEEQALLEGRGEGASLPRESLQDTGSPTTGILSVQLGHPSLPGVWSNSFGLFRSLGHQPDSWASDPLGSHVHRVLVAACHLEAIRAEMVSSTCYALGVAGGQPSTARF